MSSEQQRVYSEAERAALVAAARAWPGTQAEFAAQHGISQGTVSRWLGATPRREYPDAERAAFLADLRSWSGSLRSFAAARGIPQATLSRWVKGDRRAHRARRSHAVVRRDAAPAMIEVVTATAPPVRAPATPAPASVQLTLGDGVVLTLDALPPTRWVAELAAELRRC